MKVPDWLESEARGLGTIEANSRRQPLTAEEILRALQNPIWPAGGGATVFRLVQPGESVCFIVSDYTRKTATDQVLPVILDGLLERGCRLEDMRILVASGIHRPPTPQEMEQILGRETARRFLGRIALHNPDDDANLVAVGTTRRGHRVRVNRLAAEADRLIPIGAATYHYHAGFGGGRKSLVPGVAARETIAYNHSLTLDPEADRIRPGVDIGALDGNAVAEEMLEGARMCRPDIIVNTVLTPDGALAGVFSGELDAAHRAACRLVEALDGVDIPGPADFVIASAEGAPNWIQSHKALFNAHRAIRAEGRVILIAPCPEGLGDERFRYWVRRPAVADIYRELRTRVEVLGQTALSTRTRGARCILITGLSPADCEDLRIETAPDVEAAVRRVVQECRARGAGVPSYYLMPHARHTVPFTARSRCPGAGSSECPDPRPPAP